MIRLLELFREGFIQLGREPIMAAPAGALVVFFYLAGFLPQADAVVLVASAGQAAAAAAYSVLLEPGLRRRAPALFLLFFLPWALLLGVQLPITRFVTANAFTGSMSHLWINGLSAFQHLTVMAVGLAAAVTARSFDALEEGLGALAAWREAWSHALDRWQSFLLLAVVYWIGEHVFGGVLWPFGPFLAAVLLHAGVIHGARKL